jgi:hypothetical protein
MASPKSYGNSSFFDTILSVIGPEFKESMDKLAGATQMSRDANIQTLLLCKVVQLLTDIKKMDEEALQIMKTERVTLSLDNPVVDSDPTRFPGLSQPKNLEFKPETVSAPIAKEPTKTEESKMASVAIHSKKQPPSLGQHTMPAQVVHELRNAERILGRDPRRVPSGEVID